MFNDNIVKALDSLKYHILQAKHYSFTRARLIARLVEIQGITDKLIETLNQMDGEEVVKEIINDIN